MYFEVANLRLGRSGEKPLDLRDISGFWKV
jgi:hypothetical protein